MSYAQLDTALTHQAWHHSLATAVASWLCKLLQILMPYYSFVQKQLRTHSHAIAEDGIGTVIQSLSYALTPLTLYLLKWVQMLALAAHLPRL